MGTYTMQSKALPRTPADLRADRELQLKEFVESSIASAQSCEQRELLLVARSPESLACQVVFGLSATLEKHGITARIVLMAAGAGEQWSLEFAPGFCHEIRLGTDHRLLDAHEQLVIGAAAIWYGDSMRREPERRDALALFTADNAEAGRRGRLTFDRLWSGCRPLYRHEFTPAEPTPVPLERAPTAPALPRN